MPRRCSPAASPPARLDWSCAATALRGELGLRWCELRWAPWRWAGWAGLGRSAARVIPWSAIVGQSAGRPAAGRPLHVPPHPPQLSLLPLSLSRPRSPALSRSVAARCDRPVVVANVVSERYGSGRAGTADTLLRCASRTD